MDDYKDNPAASGGAKDSGIPGMEPLAGAADPTRKINLKSLLILAAGAVALIVLVILLFGGRGNTYKTPLDLEIAFMNDMQDMDPDDLSKRIVELRAVKSGYIGFMASTEAGLASLEEEFEYWVEQCEDYEFSYKIESKEELEKGDLREFRSNYREYYERILARNYGDAEDFTSQQWNELADELGCTKSEAKELVGEFVSLCEEKIDAEVTEGYELEIVVTATDVSLDDEDEIDMTIRVYKVDGEWVIGGEFLLILGELDAYGLFNDPYSYYNSYG